MDKEVDQKHLWKDKAWMQKNYIEKQLSCRQVAVLAGCDPMTIYGWLIRLKIHVRTKREVADLRYGKGSKVISTFDEQFDRLFLDIDEDLAQERMFYEFNLMTPEEDERFLEREAAREKQLREEETKKRWAREAAEQIKLREELKKTSTRLEGTAKEQILNWQDMVDDLSGYKD